MIQTYIVYVSTLIFCCAMARAAALRENKRYLWLIIWALTLVSGLRGYHVGLDTYNYLNMFSYIAAGQGQYAYGMETSFKLIIYLLSKIWNNSTFYLLVFALITNTLILLRFWDFRKISSLPWMVFCYYCVLYFMTMNGIRQFCAVAIVFYSTRYLNQKRLIPFLFSVAVASLLHQTAFIGLIYAVEQLSNWRQLSKWERRLMMCCIAACPVALTYILTIVERYEQYFAFISLNMGIMIPAKIGLFLLSAMFVRQYYRRKRWEQIRSDVVVPYFTNTVPWICYAYAVGILFTGLGYFFKQADRIGWYFYLYEGVYYGMLRKDKNVRNRTFFGLCNAFLVLYAFLNSIRGNSQGNVPYLFFWQIF